MNETAQAAMKMLQKKLEIIKEDAERRTRLNLKGYAEECLALLDIIRRNTNEPVHQEQEPRL